MGEKELDCDAAGSRATRKRKRHMMKFEFRLLTGSPHTDFRRDVLVRFDKYLARIMRGNNTDQIETALILRLFWSSVTCRGVSSAW